MVYSGTISFNIPYSRKTSVKMQLLSSKGSALAFSLGTPHMQTELHLRMTHKEEFMLEFMLELPALKCWEHTCVTGPDSKEGEGVKGTQFYRWVGGQALPSLETWHCLLSQICSCSAHQLRGLYGLQESVSRAVRPSSQNDRYWWV